MSVIKKKRRQSGWFDIKQHLKRDTHNQYRLYYIIGTIVAPIFSFLVFDQTSPLKNIIIDISIPFIFLCILISSFYSDKIRDSLKAVFFVFCIFLSIYAYLIYADSGYTINNFLGFMIAFFAIIVGINDHRLSLIYSLFCLTLITIFHFIWPEAIKPVGIETEISALLIIGIVGFVIHYNSYRALQSILYNDGLLNSILNSTDDGMLLLDSENQILDLNKKAESLFKAETKTLITGRKLNEILFDPAVAIKHGKNDFLRTDGSLLIAQTNINKIEYEGWEYTILIITDLTQNIQFTKELEVVKSQLVESEKTYRELFDNSLDLLFILDSQFYIIDVNKQILDKSKKLDEEFLNINFFDLIIDEDEKEKLKIWIGNDDLKETEISLTIFGGRYDFNYRKALYYGIEHFVLSARSAENRMLYENVLKESRDRTIMILESINSIIYYQEVNEDGSLKLKYLSPKIEQIIGISVDEFITLAKAKKVNDIIHTDDFDKVVEMRKRVMDEKKSVEFVYRVRKGTEYIWLEERIYPKFDDKGRHISNFGVSTDVTENYKSKIALEELNKKNKNFIERNLAGFYRIDTHKNILDCNDSFASIFGFKKAADIIGKNVNDIYIDSSDRNIFIQKLRENKSILNNESKITLINGKTIWILENASLVIDKNNQEYIESTVFNITDLKEAEIALEKSEETLSMILNNIEDLIYNVEFMSDGTRVFNYLGNQVEDITGLTRSEYILNVNRNTIQDFIHPDDLSELLRKTTELKEKRINQDFVYRFKAKGKGFVWIEESVFPQFKEDGSLHRMFGVVREISEKKKYEEEILQSEERYRTIFEKNLAGVFRTTLTGKFIDCNDAFLRIFGYSSKEELFNVSSKDLYFEIEDRDKYIQDLKKENNLFNYELSHKRKDGSRVWVLANVSLLKNEEGEPEFIQGTLVDISKQKQISEALTESEEKFRLLFEATNDSIFILDGESIVDCNEKSLESFGLTVNDKVLTSGANLFDMSPKFQPDGLPSADKIKHKIKEVLSGNSQMFYWRFQRKDGLAFDAEVSMNLVSLEHKLFIQAIIRDITARMKAEFALRESEDRFKMLSNATIEGIIFTDNGVIIDANEQFAIMYGYNSRNKVIGKNIEEFLYGEEEVDMVRKIIEKQSEEKFEVRSKRTDGKIVWVESKGRMIPHQGRRIRVSVVYDITERKLREQELQESRESFMNLTELSPNGSIIHIDGIIQYANPTVIRFLGKSDLKDLVGKNILDLLPEDQHEKSKERIARLKKGENVGFAEMNIYNSKRQIMEIGIQSVRIIYNGTEAIHVIISDLSQQKQLQKETLRAQLAEETNTILEKEIQERKEAEQRLWETQMFTTNMFNSSLDMIMASDRNNLITQINNSVLKIFGYKTDELIGMHPKDLYASEADFEVVRLSLLSKGTFTGEIINKKKNGEIFTSYLSASVLRNSQGKIIGTMGISRDITDVILAQKKIQEQNAQIRSIFDNASNMLIWTIDKNYNLVAFNNNFLDIVEHNFGVKPVKGMNIVSILKPFLKEEYMDYSIKSFERTFGGQNSELEGPFSTLRGNSIWIETFLNPIFLEDGAINEISCISHEITEKKYIENQIRNSLKEKEVLLKEVHHRVKNNLQVISSILNLQSSYVKDEQTLSILRESQNRIKSMSFIHESLYQTKNFSSIDFSDYIINLSNNLFHSYQIFDNFIELKLDIDPVSLNLDQAIPCGLIVNEIITNALKYAFVGRKRGEILIGITENDNAVTLRLEDNGVGLPKGFNYRKTETLGLQLVVTLVEQLDGKLEITSKKGTKYLITFEKLN